jgi:hypothetical protein
MLRRGELRLRVNTSILMGFCIPSKLGANLVKQQVAVQAIMERYKPVCSIAMECDGT